MNYTIYQFVCGMKYKMFETENKEEAENYKKQMKENGRIVNIESN